MANEEETMLYTFSQPVRGGHYYIVIRASSNEEAAQVMVDIVNKFEHRTERLTTLSVLPEGTLVLAPKIQEQLDETGYAYTFAPTPPRPYQKYFGGE